MEVLNKARLAKDASRKLGILSSVQKDKALEMMAKALEDNIPDLIAENKLDVSMAIKNGRHKALIDRLILNEERIKGMAEGLRVIRGLPDPVGEVIYPMEKAQRYDHRPTESPSGGSCYNI